MCEFMSFFVHVDNGARVCVGDWRSHEASARLCGFCTSDDKCPWREAEWTNENERSLAIRTRPDDPPTRSAAVLRAELLVRYPSRTALLEAAEFPAGLTTLYLHGATVPEGFVIPSGCKVYR